MMSRLSAQGVNATSASGYGSAGDNSNGFGKAPLRSNSTNIVGRMLSRPQSFQSNRDETNNNEYGIILLNALKEQLISRDSKGLIGLQRQFRTMDEDGSNSLDISEFKKAMLETNVRMKKASDAEILFKLFGKYYFSPILTPTSSVNYSIFFVLYQIRIFGCCLLGNKMNINNAFIVFFFIIFHYSAISCKLTLIKKQFLIIALVSLCLELFLIKKFLIDCQPVL